MIKKKVQKSLTQRILHKATFVSKRADGTVRIVRDGYSNTKQSWSAMQKAVYLRDSNQCRGTVTSVSGISARCTNRRPETSCEVHHIKPLSAGGKTILYNLILLCMKCHDKRHHHLKRIK